MRGSFAGGWDQLEPLEPSFSNTSHGRYKYVWVSIFRFNCSPSRSKPGSTDRHWVMAAGGLREPWMGQMA